MNLLVILVQTGLILSFIDAVSTRKGMSWLSKELRTVRSSKMCMFGDGMSYRGTEAVSARGKKCLPWSRFGSSGAHEAALGLGFHNYCRNPDQMLMPWCRVKRGRRIVREFCDIPNCPIPTTKPPAPVTPAVDTGPIPTTKPPAPVTPAVDTGPIPTTKPPAPVTPAVDTGPIPTTKPPAPVTPAVDTGPIPTTKPPAPVTPAVDTELTCGEETERRQNKIVGGVVASIESQPWVAAIFHKRSSFLCGGSLITPCWVLTAAHCFPASENIQMRRLSVYLGKSAINDTDVDREQSFTVEQLIIHSNYNDTDGNNNNDIALLKIRSSEGSCAERTDSVRTVCLPPPLTMLPPGVECSIAGYGKESSRAWQFSQVLRQARVTLLPQSTCKRRDYYGKLITQNMFCAGSPDWSTDACQGDSGGPLVCDVSGRKFVFGVVSWGDGCAQRNKPGVYTRITNYNHWIAEKMGLPAYTAGAMYPTK